MIVDQDVNILDYWNDSERQLLIRSKAGNNKTDMAKTIINQMIKEGCSILLLTEDRGSWFRGVDKSSKMLIGPYECVPDLPGERFETDMLIIHDIHQVLDDFPIEKIKFKYILILSDEYKRVVSFFKGKIIQLIDWDNISGMAFGNDGTIYRAISDYEGSITLIIDIDDVEKQESITLPVEMLKKILLE